MTRRTFVALPLLFARAGLITALARRQVRVGVFGLFHPRELIVRPADGGEIVLRTDRATHVLRGRDEVHVLAAGESLQIVTAGSASLADAVRVGGRSGGAADLEISVPGRITRAFQGQVDFARMGDALTPIVSMDLEAAVASVVAAEQGVSTPMEALKAQAVAARSYFTAARGRHEGFDFCDTTHCQFLRDPPATESLFARATGETSGAVLAFRGTPIAVLYSASCGGRTQSLADAGFGMTDGYPYFSVECPYCALHATQWDSRLALNDVTERLEVDRSEKTRLAIGRRNGWSAVPGNNFEVIRESDALVLHGRGQGHGIGLCQAGATGLAGDGASFGEILAHYLPGTTLKIASEAGH